MKKIFLMGLIGLGMLSFTSGEEVVIAEEAAGCTCTLEEEIYIYDEQGRVSTIERICIRQVCVGDSNGGPVTPISILTRE